MSFKIGKKNKSIIGATIILSSITLQSAAIINADSSNTNKLLAFETFQLEETKETIESIKKIQDDLNIISKYLVYDNNKKINYYDVEKAKANGVEERLLKEAIEYNKILLDEDNQSNENERAGRVFFEKLGKDNYKIGLSSRICKKIIKAARNGAKAVAAVLTACIPLIGPFAGVIANVFVNKVAKNLINYTSSGVIIRMQKIAGDWDIWYYKQ